MISSNQISAFKGVNGGEGGDVQAHLGQLVSGAAHEGVAFAVDGDVDVAGDLAVFVELAVHGDLVAVDGEDQVAVVVILGDGVALAEEGAGEFANEIIDKDATRHRNSQDNT